MSPDAHRIALVAASKVAWFTVLSAATAGCGGASTSIDEPGEESETPTEMQEGLDDPNAAGGSDSTDVTSPGGASAGGMSSGGSGAEGRPVSEGGAGGGLSELCNAGSDAACCDEALLEVQVETGDEWWVQWQDVDAAKENPLIVACCDAAIATGEQLVTGPTSGCCDLIEESGAQCTPWGPPTPPAFSGGWS